jgi:two-component system C4-dicarboxylate transport response regulator DctD
MTGNVLLIEDDYELRKSLTQSLELEDFSVISAGSYIEGKTHISASYPGVILSDMRMPGKDGFDVLSYTKSKDPELPVIVLTGEADVPMAVRAIGEGAYDFLQKPCPPSQLLDVLRRALDHRDVVLRSRSLEQKLKSSDAAAANFPGTSHATEMLRDQLRRSSSLPVNVFLNGPNGAGKRLAAHTIHTMSGSSRAFISLTISDLSPTQISQTPISDLPTELSAKWIEHASPEQQSALLSLIETHPNIRLIGSATQPLDKLRQNGLIDDLYFALNLMMIEVPSLSRRKKDLPVLFETLVRQSIRSLNADMPAIPESLYAQVTSRPWPDNLPELRNFAHSFALGLNVPTDRQTELTLSEQMDSFEKMIISDTLKRKSGKAILAAEALGLPRKTFYDKMARHGLKAKDFRDVGSQHS